VDPELFHPSNLKLYVITSGKMQVVEVPKAWPYPQQLPKYWDIGLIRSACFNNP